MHIAMSSAGLLAFAVVVAAAEPHQHEKSSDAAYSVSPAALWLSDSSPVRGNATQHEAHQHGSGDAVDVGEAPPTNAEIKRLWLRSGDDPSRAPAAVGEFCHAVLRVIDIHGHARVVPLVDAAGMYRADVALPDMGFYNAYLARYTVGNNELNVEVAKAELLRGTCCQKGVDPRQEIPIRDSSEPFELVRDRLTEEKLFTHISSGDKLAFTVLHDGHPTPGARVTLITQAGWRKTIVSDRKGRVEFTLIRDSFPAWSHFYRQARQPFLLIAELEVPESGAYSGVAFTTTHYRTTLPGKYYPSPRDYRSYAYGLSVVLGVTVFAGTAVYLYRRRRVKPFLEVRFSEGD